MIYYSFGEILVSALAAAVFGVIFGIIHSVLYIAVDGVRRIFRLPAVVGRLLREGIRKVKIKDLASAPPTKRRAPLVFFVDFFYTLGLSVGFLILLYNFCDGAFRLYMLLIISLFLYLSKKTLGRGVEKIFSRVLDVLTAIMAFSLAIVAFPLRAIADLLYKTIGKITGDGIKERK